MRRIGQEFLNPEDRYSRFLLARLRNRYAPHNRNETQRRRGLMKTTALTAFALLFASLPGMAQTAPYLTQDSTLLEAVHSAPYDTLTNQATPSSTLYGTPEYYAQADILIWTRRLPSGPLFVNQYTNETVENFRDTFRSRWAAGPNITVGRPIGNCWNAELNYFGLYSLNLTGATNAGRAQPIIVDPNDATRQIAAEILPFPNFRIGGAPAVTFDPRDTQIYDYTTTLNNFELNFRKDVTDRFSWLVGFRYVNLTEDLTANLYNRFGQFFGGYSIATHNNLFGAQLGGDYTAAIRDPLYLRFSGKAGVYGNAATQSTFGTFLDVNATNRANAPAHRDASGGQVSFLGQANMNLIYEITPRVHLRAGYNVMLITGLAVAPAQTTASDFGSGGRGGINTNENAFFHGMNFGIEYHH